MAYLIYGVSTPTRAHNIQSVHTVNALVKEGHEVHFYAPSIPATAQPAGSRAPINLPAAEVCLIRPGSFFRRHRMLTPRGRFWSLFFDRTIFAVRALMALRRRPVDVIVTRDLIVCFWLSAWRRFHGTPLVYELHTLEHVMFDAEDRPDQTEDPIDVRIRRLVEETMISDFAGYQNDMSLPGRAYKWALRFIESMAIRKADAVLTLTHAAKHRLRCQYGVDAGVLPSAHALPMDGRPISKHELRRELDLPADRKILIHAGLSLSGKGIDIILSMARHLPDELRVLILGGEPEQVEALKAVRASLGLASRLILRSRVAQAQAGRYMAACDIGLLLYPPTPYLAEFSSPLKLFEYLACGLVVVATDLPSLREIINDEENGMILKSYGPRSIAASLEALARDEGRLRRLSEGGVRTARAFTYDERARRLIQTLRHA